MGDTSEIWCRLCEVSEHDVEGINGDVSLSGPPPMP